jgi:hypothetical protein
MTGSTNPDLSTLATARPSLLPFDPAELVAIRVSPAQFARMCAVSKQTVSGWIKRGIVTLGPDGKLDPAVASRQVFERTDPARLRARLFKDAMQSANDLRRRVKSLEHELATERTSRNAALQAMKERCDDKTALHVFHFCAALVDDFGALADLHRAGKHDDLKDRIDDLVGRCFYPDHRIEEPEELPDPLTIPTEEPNP